MCPMSHSPFVFHIISSSATYRKCENIIRTKLIKKKIIKIMNVYINIFINLSIGRLQILQTLFEKAGEDVAVNVEFMS